MTLLFHLLQRLPAVQRLQADRDGLRSERNSMQLKLRAASAEMGVLDEQCRVLKGERDQLTKQLARQAAEHQSQAALLDTALAASKAMATERDSLNEERLALIAHRSAAEAERDRIARALDDLRQAAKPAETSP